MKTTEFDPLHDLLAGMELELNVPTGYHLIALLKDSDTEGVAEVDGFAWLEDGKVEIDNDLVVYSADELFKVFGKPDGRTSESNQRVD